MLEPSRMSLYITYPYHGLHGYSTLVTLLVIQILVTHRSHVFKCGVILQDQ